MNIGIFTDAYYPQINGVVISTQTLKEELENLGHHVTVITVSDPSIEQDQENVLRIKSIPFAVLPNFRVGQLYNRRLMKQIKALNLDIIHTQTEFSLGIFARIVAKQLHIPVVHTYHTMYEDYTHYFSPKIMDRAAKKVTQKLSCFLCRTVDNVVVPTGKVEEKLINYGFKKNINVVPTGVNLRPFSPKKYNQKVLSESRQLLNIKPDDKVILFVGRLAKEKSIDTVIDALPDVVAKNPETKFLIIGDGPEMTHLLTRVELLNLAENVIFAGKKPWSEIGIYYQLADVFVSASMSETQGLTFIEAMAAKKPVVAKYDTNLIGTIDDGVNGRFFYENNELAPILLDILNDDLLSHYLSRNALDTAERFSSEKFGRAIESVYYSTLEDSNSHIENKYLLKGAVN